MSYIELPHRLLIVLPDFGAGGAQAMNLRLASLLANRGWLVTVVALFKRQSERVHGLDLPGLKLVSIDADHLYQRILLPYRIAKLARRADVVIGGLELAATTYGYIAARIARRPFIAWIHTTFHLHMRTTSKFNQWLSLYVYRHTRYQVFPSAGAMASMDEALDDKTSHPDWHVIDNFNRCSHRKSEPAVLPCTAAFSLPVIMSMGRLSPEKRWGRLLRAHAKLRQQGIDHHLVILGEGAQRQELEREIESLAVSETVFMPGYVANPKAWLGRSTIFALCSHYEGQPLVLLEALQEGVPIVSMDCASGPREILEGGTVGILTPPGDEIAFQTALSKLLLSPELRATYVLRGLERAKFYSAERVVPIWEALLEEVSLSAPRHHAVTQP